MLFSPDWERGFFLYLGTSPTELLGQVPFFGPPCFLLSNLTKNRGGALQKRRESTYPAEILLLALHWHPGGADQLVCPRVQIMDSRNTHMPPVSLPANENLASHAVGSVANTYIAPLQKFLEQSSEKQLHYQHSQVPLTTSLSRE